MSQKNRQHPLPLVFIDEIITVRNTCTTVVQVVVEGRNRLDKSFIGVAIRHPEDKDDREVAENLSLARALKAAGKALERRANGLTKMADDNRNRPKRPKPDSLTTAIRALKSTGRKPVKKHG